MNCFAANRTESEIHPHKDSLLLLEMMDGIRSQWKLVYPFEVETKVATSETETVSAQIEDFVLESPDFTKAEEKAETTENASSPNFSPKPCNTVPEKITIYTDGACSGNPGKGGWGAVILVDSDEYRLSGGEKLTTNNRMELMAAIEALEKVVENPMWKKSTVTLISDSQYVKNGIQSWIHAWKKNGWRTANKEPVKNKDLWLELDELASELNISWQWVKGHAGNKYNEICDSLAVAAGKNV